MKIKLAVFFKDLIHPYLENRKSELKEVTDFIEKKDFLEIESCFHKIAGSAGTYGIDILSDIAAKIEEASMSKDIEAIKKGTEEYMKTLNSIEIIFENE